jgi:hypothetical protein
MSGRRENLITELRQVIVVAAKERLLLISVDRASRSCVSVPLTGHGN